jgi:predicted Zn-dependent protease with MMP-like domain
MIIISSKEFEELVERVVAQLPKDYLEKLKNVAFIVEEVPNENQRRQLSLRPNQTLFGLYEGVPLSERQGATKMLPDKITLFKRPLENASSNINALFQNIGKTVWHEVAHYYGLNHDMINDLEKKK